MKATSYLKTTLALTGCLLYAPLFAQPTVINVNPSATSGKINPGIYGVNQRWFDYDIRHWEPGEGKESKLIKNYRDIGLRSLRYPAGTAADAFDWKRSIGPRDKRAKVIEGHTWEFKRNASPGGESGNGGHPLPVDFGLDDVLRFCEKNNTILTYMYNFGTGNAANAADLVEYVNSPLGTNPNGGVAWAQVRASNGHPAPYKVMYFEMGNEMYVGGRQHFWLEGKSSHDHTYKYCFGDTVRYSKQLVGEYDAQSVKAAKSNYTPNQVKYLRYPPILPGTDSVFVGGVRWKRVDNLKKSGAENVYELDRDTGKLAFGDGVHGNLPLNKDSLATIRASYVAVREGFTHFYKAMKAVDPGINVLSCLFDRKFIDYMGAKHPYDGVTVHPYAGFWNLPETESVDNYHDLVLSNSDEEADSAAHTLDLIRKTVSPERRADMELLYSEYGIALGSIANGYSVSMDQALYAARMVISAIDLNMAFTSKHALSGIIGSEPDFIISPTGYMFKMFTQMFGPNKISSSIINNPERSIIPNHFYERFNKVRKTLPKLHLTASKDEAGNVYLMVLNRDRADAVVSTVNLSTFVPQEKATVWTLTGDSYTAHNTAQKPDNVTINESTLVVSGSSFSYTFPPHSITAIKLNGNLTSRRKTSNN
ncbi:MAG: hypothetical protein H7Z72_03780 [Bacteroidetes bacterium]|nr:hypothetical protein [Fibrella sp.]